MLPCIVLGTIETTRSAWRVDRIITVKLPTSCEKWPSITLKIENMVAKEFERNTILTLEERKRRATILEFGCAIAHSSTFDHARLCQSSHAQICQQFGESRVYASFSQHPGSSILLREDSPIYGQLSTTVTVNFADLAAEIRAQLRGRSSRLRDLGATLLFTSPSCPSRVVCLFVCSNLLGAFLVIKQRSWSFEI